MIRLFTNKPSANTVTTFTRALSEFLNAGVLLPDSLQMLSSSQTQTSHSRLAKKIHVDLQQGNTLRTALQKHPHWFDDLYVNIADAGFSCGQLGEFLSILVDYRTTKEATRQQIIRAVTYPVLVFFFAMVIAIILLVQIVPRFEHLFINAGESLPAITRFMMDTSNFLINYGLYLLFILVVFALIFRMLATFYLCRRIWQQILLFVPIISKWKKMQIKEEYLRSLATMLKARLSLLRASTIAARSCTIVSYSQMLEKVSEKLQLGESLDRIWISYFIFDDADILAAKLGSKGADLAKLLMLRSDYYRMQLSNTLQAFLRLLEPCLMIFIGAIIGLMVLAVYLPLFSVGQAI